MTQKLTSIKPVIYAADLDPEADIEIDKHALAKEFRLYPPIYYRYCMEVSYAQEKVNDAKLGLKEIRGRVYLDLKNHATKYSETHLGMLIEQDPLVSAQTKLLGQYEYELRNFEGFLQALKFKKDCLVQLGADARKEN